MGVVVITAGLVILSTLLADILYAWLDPRIRFT
jgi:ABC-type dipeptide/oligopeptide/nickel transport system permease component